MSDCPEDRPLGSSVQYVRLTNDKGEVMLLHPRTNAYRVAYQVAEGEVCYSEKFRVRVGVQINYYHFLRFIAFNNNIAKVDLPDGRAYKIGYEHGVHGGYPTSKVYRID
ncbi:MAG: hypothetical protein GX808_12640 [Syntrophomonadaceae bacterium]|nr:hypothetical protein [Syntrophomonadaceae bacterium]